MPDDPRQKNALLVAASLIAAVRPAREEEIKGTLTEDHLQGRRFGAPGPNGLEAYRGRLLTEMYDLPMKLSLIICALCLLETCAKDREHRQVPKLFVSLAVACGSPNATEPLNFTNQNVKLCLDQSPIVTERDVRSARLPDRGFGFTPIVLLSLQQQASERLRDATAAHPHERIGIVLKGEPFSAPLIVGSTSEVPLARNLTQPVAEELMREFNGQPSKSR